MKIHEYQAKKLFSSFGIPVPRGEVTTTAEQAGKIARSFAGPVVVKAQIYAGGRGKAGGGAGHSYGIRVKMARERAARKARSERGHTDDPEGDEASFFLRLSLSTPPPPSPSHHTVLPPRRSPAMAAHDGRIHAFS